ncbi:MAG: phosphate acetyltransferase [Gammaproteobacteria bacterium]|nr:phosphate acetyltransferase [Gammaproteobacteria bacterium]
MNNSSMSISNSKTPLPKIVLAEGDDTRIIAAAARAHADEIANCILVGNRQVIASAARQSLDSIQIEDPQTSKNTDHYAQNLYNLRSKKAMTREQASELVLDPLHFSDLMVRAGDADGSIAGARYTTGDRIRSALQIIGVAPGFSTVSSFFLMIFEADYHQPKRRLLFADCALVVDPSAEQLAEIAKASADSASKILGEPARVAMLSFSTNGSANHNKVDKVREATVLLRKAKPNIAIDGEIQLDSAIIPAIAEQKFPDSQTRGNANVLIFPDLNAGNIGYKLAERFGGGKAVGPILQGLTKPANDLSRGCSADDVYELIRLTAKQATA